MKSYPEKLSLKFAGRLQKHAGIFRSYNTAAITFYACNPRRFPVVSLQTTNYNF